MSSYLGLDPNAVRQLASAMNNAAQEIQSIQQKLSGQLENTQWTGPDRQRFLSEWQGTHCNQLHTVVQALQHAAQTANTNAQQQEQVSNA